MPPTDSSHPRRRPLLRTGAAVALALWAALGTIPQSPRPESRVVGFSLTATAPGVWAVDLAQSGRMRAQPLPMAPFEGQKRPPCGGAQVEKGGGCWYRVQPDPSKLLPGEVCSPELYQAGKECYLPVLDAGPTPVARSP